MNIPSEFDAIRPYEPEELPVVYERLLQNPQFQMVLAYVMPGIPFDDIAERMRSCKTNLEFQKAFCYPFLKELIAKASKGCDMDVSEIDQTQRYTFISNHRDIVLDSAFLSMLLIDSQFDTTCEIAIGDNLMFIPWVSDLVRINKSIKVERSLQTSEKLRSSKRLAEYMHFAISQKRENLWIAQREGRCKDSDDRTQDAVLKMIALGGQGAIIDRLLEMHFVPLSISYEYDPCDYLKAREAQCKRDTPDWKKGPNDDMESMQTGLFGYKGHIHYHCAPCIDDFLKTLDVTQPKADLFRGIAKHIDHHIHRNYRLYPVNYVALDLLQGTEHHTAHYSAEDKVGFEHYVEGQLSKIELPNRDEAFLKNYMYTMYANPAINHLAAL
ncbi:MAG TPA: 1-acyl-sn-glycerol-3-phosphate acyltransferase [Prevotella sp.]